MKTPDFLPACRRLRLGLLTSIFAVLPWLSVQAGLHMNMSLYGGDYGYYCYAWLSTNSTPPSPPDTGYFIWSPASTINSGIHSQLNPDNTQSGSGSSEYSDFSSFIHEITNGNWTLLITNVTSTNWYHFTVSVPSGLSSNTFALANITFPTQNQMNVSNTPVFTWTGPVGWLGSLYIEDDSVDANYNYSYQASASLTTDQTSWACPVMLANGANYIYVSYYSNATDTVLVSTPVDSNSVVLPDFTWQSTLAADSSRNFSVSVSVASGGSGGHTNLAYYNFEDDMLFTHDVSGHANNINIYGGSPYISSDAVAGNYAYGNSGVGDLYLPTNLLSALAGSFSVAVWLKTSATFGNDEDSIYSAVGVVSALSGVGPNVVVPIGINGGKVAFFTGGGFDDNLHSQTSVNTGGYVHVVVTRDQATGEKKIYINGALDASDFGATDRLDDADEAVIGSNNGQYFTGELDEIQIYAGVLSAEEVSDLYQNPGTRVADSAGQSGPTGHVLAAHYTFNDGNILYVVDDSGNGYDISTSSTYNDGSVAITGDSREGDFAASFDDHGGTGAGWLTPPDALVGTLAGSFSISVWLKTSQTSGADTDDGIYNAGIISAFDSPDTNYVIPMAITGNKLAFVTEGNGGAGVPDTLHSTADINSGGYTHVVVTRDATTGAKMIYVNGALDASDTGVLGPLNGPESLNIGENDFQGFNGELDDIQIYQGVLSADDVAQLHNNPGTTAPDNLNLPALAAAVNAANASWFTRGDSDWFPETNVSHDGISAAQSGVVTNYQSSTLQATVTGPGTLTFWWQTADDGNFDLEFDIDGDYQNDIWDNQPWTQDGPYTIGPGQHTLTWTAYDGDGSPTNAGWVDGVSFIPEGDLTGANLSVSIVRYNDPVSGSSYSVFASPYGITPESLTNVTVVSPGGEFSGNLNGSSSYGIASLAEVISDCTNGLWTIYTTNGASVSTYTFSMAITGLDTNLLSAVQITSPTNGSTGVSVHPVLTWTGPTGFDGIFAQTHLVNPFGNSVSTNLPGTATNWPSPPALLAGTNQFYLSIHKDNVSFITTTVPVNGSGNPLNSWNSVGYVSSDTLSQFTVSSAVPVQLLNPQVSGGALHFSFLTELNQTNTIETRTNLATGAWMPMTNFVGNGTTQMFSISITSSPAQFFRVKTE